MLAGGKTAPEDSGTQGLGGKEWSIALERVQTAATTPPEHSLTSVLGGGHLPSCREQGTTKLCCIKSLMQGGPVLGRREAWAQVPVRKPSVVTFVTRGHEMALEGTLLPSGQAASEKQPGVSLTKVSEHWVKQYQFKSSSSLSLVLPLFPSLEASWSSL